MPQKTGRLLFLLIFTFLFSFVLVFSASALQRGDIDEDGAVTAADASRLRQALPGCEVSR